MDFDDVVALLRALPETEVLIASEAGGAPQSNWGNAFAMYAPDAVAERMPFATVVLANMEGDESSRLDRPGVFRVNLGVGRDTLAQRADTTAPPDALDRWFAHPVYAAQGWICISSPTEDRRPEVEELLRLAYDRERNRHARRSS